MTEADRIWFHTYSPQKREKLTEAYRQAKIFQIEQIKNGNWTYRENFNREYVGCRYGEGFSNTVSPILKKEVERRWPELSNLVKDRSQPELL